MEIVDPKIYTLLWFCCIKKKMTIILKIKEGTFKVQRADKLQNLKRHIPLVSLQLWQRLMAMCCVV